MERGRTSPPTTLTERGRTGHHVSAGSAIAGERRGRTM